MQSIIIEANPQTKERARFRNGRAYTPIRTRMYQERVARIWREKYPEPNAGAVAIYVQFYLRIPSSWTKAKKDRAERGEILPTVRPDVDNLAKCIFACSKCGEDVASIAPCLGGVVTWDYCPYCGAKMEV